MGDEIDRPIQHGCKHGRPTVSLCSPDAHLSNPFTAEPIFLSQLLEGAPFAAVPSVILGDDIPVTSVGERGEYLDQFPLDGKLSQFLDPASCLPQSLVEQQRIGWIEPAIDDVADQF